MLMANQEIMVKVGEYEPTTSEKRMAAVMHIAGIFAPWLAPLGFYAVNRKKSRYIADHSLDSIFGTLTFSIFLGVIFLISMALSIRQLYIYWQSDWEVFRSWEAFWPAAGQFVVKFIVVWILLTIFQIINTILSIKQAAEAIAGRWPKFGRKKRQRELEQLT